MDKPKFPAPVSMVELVQEAVVWDPRFYGWGTLLQKVQRSERPHLM